MSLVATQAAPVSSSFAGVVSLWRRCLSAVSAGERALLPGYAVLVGAVLAPLAFGIASFTLHWPGLGMPGLNPLLSIDLYSLHAGWLAFFVTVALLVKDDRPLALALILTAAIFYYRGGLLGSRHILMFAVGALLLHGVRALPASTRRAFVSIVAGLGVAQAAYVMLQVWGYDPLWFRFDGGTFNQVQPYGTIGTVDAAAAYVAITTPLMAPWLMPLGIGAVLHCKSGGALLALIVGLALRFRHRVPLLRLTLGAVSFLYVTLYWQSHNAHTLPFNKIAQSIFGRLAIWEVGIRAWLGSTTSPLVGWGLGGWDTVIPQIQQRYHIVPTPEWWREAHNDLLQFVIEAGVLGGLLLAWWVYRHRAMFLGTWGPSVAALTIVSLTFFPWHVASTAFLGLLILGCATAPAGGSA